MEHKNNYGPHLIIVPNAVIVNWKGELQQWLPSARCVFYVGNKEERARKYATEVQALQFNVLVTTYEYIMRDRSRLAKVIHSPCTFQGRPLCRTLFMFNFGCAMDESAHAVKYGRLLHRQCMGMW